MKVKFIIPVMLLLVACSCGNDSLTESEKEKVKGEASTAVKEFINAVSVNDTSKLVSMLYNDPDVSMIIPAGILGITDMKKMMAQFFPLIEKQTFETISEKYLVLDDDYFVYTWIGNNGMYMKSGESIMYEDYMLSYLFKKTGGNWKIVHGHESSLIPEVADPVKEFTAIEAKWNQAIMDKDEKTLDLLYAKEYTYVDGSGKEYNKQEDINEIKSGKYKLLAPSVLSDIKVNMYGKTAVVRGLNTIKAQSGGKDISGTVRFSDVFVWREGRWQCVSTQGIQLPKK